MNNYQRDNIEGGRQYENFCNWISFVRWKNLVENLKNIMTSKNRTRPDLSVSMVLEDTVDAADVLIILPGESVVPFLESTGNKRLIIVSFLNQSFEDGSVLEKPNILVYRVPEIVGKWQEPDTGIAYYCDAVANDKGYAVPDHNQIFHVLFVDDFIEEILNALEGRPHRCEFPEAGTLSADPTAAYDGKTPVPDDNGKFCYVPKCYFASVGSIVDQIEAFNRLYSTTVIQEISADSFAYKLCSMYLSYLPVKKMSYPLPMNIDNRGIFTELVKTPNNGQVSINIARPGNIRGQHWHNTKWEIFIVVSGHGLIQERKIGTDEVLNFEVRGEEMRAVIMLPGYTHNIINLEKDKDLVTVMYDNEQFDPKHPDTFFEIVDDTII